MNFLLLDDAGEVIARSRSLAALQAAHGGASQRHYATQSRLATGARRWEFGELAEQVEVARGGLRQLGYPALVDEGDSVGLRVFATPQEAQASHRRGCARLIRLVLSRELKSMRRDLPVNVQAELAFRGVAPGRDLRDDLLDRIVTTVFLDGRELPRTAAAFDARVEAGRPGIGLPAQEIGRCVQAALERLGRIQSALAGSPRSGVPEATAADLRLQLQWLVPAEFLVDTPWERLQDLPRYLQAIEQRLEKAGRDPRRDAQLAAQVAPLEARDRARLEAERGRWRPAEDPYRWLLEEFRVSLFAQQLRTRVPVSARRLEDAWAERQRAVN
jgi:ATP-dependent helicase HrpA